MSRWSTWLIAAGILLATLAWQTAYLQPAPPPLPVLHTLGGDFALPSTLGPQTRLSDFRGQLILLNFGYTGCPDICPTALARMRDALAMLPEGRDLVRPVFVTLDPEVDTVGRMRPYLGFFDTSFVGITGSDAQIADVASDYKVYYTRQPLESALGYSISHSAQIYLLDTGGRVRATFGEGVPVDQIAGTVDQLLRETNQQTTKTTRDGGGEQHGP